ncbi:hypothetical protein, partial [Halomonas sp. BC04]|uniref:hypothetical protein n=1 Tax=Halomonas sp. BC04 TaxID=1403540 RepID=UPI0005B840F3
MSGEEGYQLPSRRDALIEILLMMLATVPVLASGYASLLTGEGHWFQRSGALMVLFSIGVEYHRKRMRVCFYSNRDLVRFGISRWMIQLTIRFWRTIPFACYFSIAVGT